jgi:hypothetical protein
MRLHVDEKLFFLKKTFTWRRMDAGPRELYHQSKKYFFEAKN